MDSKDYLSEEWNTTKRLEVLDKPSAMTYTMNVPWNIYFDKKLFVRKGFFGELILKELSIAYFGESKWNWT